MQDLIFWFLIETVFSRILRCYLEIQGLTLIKLSTSAWYQYIYFVFAMMCAK